MDTGERGLYKRAQPEQAEGEQATKRPKGSRRRVTIACEECRIRKRRCDGAVPVCGACMKRASTCEYTSDLQPGDWRGRYACIQYEYM